MLTTADTLTPQELQAITGRKTLRQQVARLVALGVPVRVRPRAPAVERADHSRIGSRNHSRNGSAHEQ